MPSIFGFENNRTRRGTPQPAEVGALLLQRQQGGPPTEAAPEPTPEPDPHVLAQQTDWPSSAEAALRAASLRGPGRATPSHERPPAPLSRSQLQRLGVPEQEIDLLVASGGTNA